MLTPHHVTLTVDVTRYQDAMRRAARSVRTLGAALDAHMKRIRRRRTHPFAYPAPLPINGHAYRARTRRRRNR